MPISLCAREGQEYHMITGTHLSARTRERGTMLDLCQSIRTLLGKPYFRFCLQLRLHTLFVVPKLQVPATTLGFFLSYGDR
jgi:hypothetical protein